MTEYQTATKEPENKWTTEEEKIKHEGDLFYNTETGRAYRYIYDETSKKHEWNVITDEAITKALANAQKAQDTADGKRRTFINEPYPPYDKGDLWTQGDDGDLMVCINAKENGQFDENDWIKAVKYTDDRAWEAWCSDTGEFGKYKKEIKTQIDGKSDCSYGGSEPPMGAESGDLWFCTDDSDGYDKNKAYMYDGSEWKEANGVPDSVWDIADGKSSIFVKKPCKRLSNTDLNYYHANDFWILENDIVLNEKEYKKGSIMTATSDSKSFVESHWVEKVRYTDDIYAKSVENELNKYKSEITVFQNKINNSLFATSITDKYVISPKIGGGYLYISQDEYGSVSIDPRQINENNDGYIFAVKNSSEKIVMGVDIRGNAVFSGKLEAATGTFSGDIKIGYKESGYDLSPYNCIIDSKGFRIGVGDGGSRYAFKVDNAGNVESIGTLNVGNSLLYNQRNGLGLNANLIIFNGGKLVFSEKTFSEKIWNSGVINEQDSCGYISLMTDLGSPGIDLYGMNLDISASRTLTLYSGASPVTVKGDLKLENGNLYSSTAPITTSDKKRKDKINLLNEKYEEFFMKLVPVSFLFKDGNSGRTHIGFISQDVETAMFECGLTDLDFAGFCKDVKQETYVDENGNESYRDVLDENGNPVYIYSLRYEEFIPLNTHMLQKCINKINDLENKILHLQDGNS